MFSEVAEIALVAARLGQFQKLLKTRVILILNFTRPHAITYTNVIMSLTYLTLKENIIKNFPWIWEICLNSADLIEKEG